MSKAEIQRLKEKIIQLEKQLLDFNKLQQNLEEKEGELQQAREMMHNQAVISNKYKDYALKYEVVQEQMNKKCLEFDQQELQVQLLRQKVEENAREKEDLEFKLSLQTQLIENLSREHHIEQIKEDYHIQI